MGFALNGLNGDSRFRWWQEERWASSPEEKEDVQTCQVQFELYSSLSDDDESFVGQT